MIYFARLSGGSIKIGHTGNLKQRLADLANYYGTPPVILKTSEGDRDEEQALHARFAHLRFDATEQFRPGDDLMDFIGHPRTQDVATAEKTAHATILHCRMPTEVLADMDDLAKHHGLTDRTAVVRFLVRRETRKIENAATSVLTS